MVLRFLLPEEAQVAVTQGCVYERTVWGQMWLSPWQQIPLLIVRGEERLGPGAELLAGGVQGAG